MKMPGQNELSLVTLRAAFAPVGIVPEQKKMFGHETYFLRGYMFAGVFDQDIFVNVGEEKANASQESGIGYFEPMGKRMKAYIALRPGSQNQAAVQKWLKIGAAHIGAMKPKQKAAGPKPNAARGKKKTQAARRTPKKNNVQKKTKSTRR